MKIIAWFFNKTRTDSLKKALISLTIKLYFVREYSKYLLLSLKTLICGASLPNLELSLFVLLDYLINWLRGALSRAPREAVLINRLLVQGVPIRL